MKKQLFLLITGLMIIGLVAACGSTPQEEAQQQQQNASIKDRPISTDPVDAHTPDCSESKGLAVDGLV